MVRGACPRRSPLQAGSREPGQSPLRARGSLAGARSPSSLSGGLGPAGPPCTRARGDPGDPRSARVAPSLALVRFSHPTVLLGARDRAGQQRARLLQILPRVALAVRAAEQERGVEGRDELRAAEVVDPSAQARDGLLRAKERPR